LGFLEITFKALGFQTRAEKLGHVLESTLLVRRAVSAVHIMNGEEQAKSALLKASHGRSVGLDNQRREDPDSAGRNGFPLDFHETQSARGIRVPHAFKIAEVRDINTVAEAGFEQNSPLLNLNLFMIDQDLDHKMLTPLLPWVVARSPGPGAEGRPS
jgi:hypothetical protein